MQNRGQRRPSRRPADACAASPWPSSAASVTEARAGRRRKSVVLFVLAASPAAPATVVARARRRGCGVQHIRRRVPLAGTLLLCGAPRLLFLETSANLFLPTAASMRGGGPSCDQRVASAGWLTGWRRAMTGRTRTRPCARPSRLNRLYNSRPSLVLAG
jgi:hypothetical protein